MKFCFKCHAKKDLSEFYKHKGMSDGHLNKCKECTKKDVSNNLKDKSEYYKQYEKSRSTLPHRVEARKLYSESEKGKEVHNKAKRRWTERNKDKREAHNKLSRALRSRQIEKSDKCQLCGVSEKRLEGHHYDYSNPLDVTWLCSECHRLFHKSNKLKSENFTDQINHD